MAPLSVRRVTPCARLALAAALCAGAAPARAAGPEGVAALLQGSAFDGGSASVLVRGPEASVPPTPPTPRAAPAETELIPPSLWDAAQPPDAAARALLSARLPGLDLASVRELPFSVVDPVVAEAARHGDSCLDIFSDAGLRGKAVYYLSQETAARVFAKYAFKSITLAGGEDEGGRPFRLLAIVMGGGRLELLYDRDEFTYANPDFPDHRYTAKSRVSETIEGPGDMRIDGLRVAMIFHPKIVRFVEVSPTEVRVETSLASRVAPLFPVRLRAP